MIGAVSAAEMDSNDELSSSDDSAVGIDLPGVIPIDPINPFDPFNPTPGDDDEPIDVEVDVKDIYVKDTGNDSNTGSEESPYASIGRAVHDVNASNNATIYIGEGTFLLDEYLVDEEGEEVAYNGLYIDLNHKSYGGNLKFIGAGADKTFLDGQSSLYFATINSNANVLIKDVTFINCKNDIGGTIVNYGNLTVENCVFEDSYAIGKQGGAIYSANPMGGMIVIGDQSKIYLTVKNSKFISSSVNSYQTASIMDRTPQGGGAIYAYRITELYLENNTFVNTRLAPNGGMGAAVLSSTAKNYLINNKFINLTGTQDASMYIDDAKDSSITGNEFINCSNPSNTYSIVYIGGTGEYIFENNIFTNSSNSVGNIYVKNGRLSSLNFTIDEPVINVSNYEINNGVVIPLTITDDMGNIVKLIQDFKLQFTSENYSFTHTTPSNAIEYRVGFGGVPENGIYNITIDYNKNINTNEYSTTGVLGILNVSTSNEPVELYVSPEGNDANAGTFNSPFKTIQHAIDVGFEETFTVIVHLLKGTYSGEDNVKLTIANTGSLQIIGEEYGKTIIDGNNTDWFLSISNKCVIENLSFINGKSTSNNLIYRGTLKNCIFSNNSVASDSKYTISQTKFDNLTYTDNYGRIYASYDISNSYFENNEFISNGQGGIIYAGGGVTIENSTFKNNSARYAGVIYANGAITSRNNYYEKNKAVDHASSIGTKGSGGVIFTTNSGSYTFENDTYINNHAYESGVVGWKTFGNAQYSPFYTFTDCKFINNTAVEGGVAKLKAGNFTNCEFINNTADYGGAISLLPYIKDSYTLELNDIVFNGNVAKESGNDIYLAPKPSYGYSGNDNVYAIALTIDFNDLNVDSFADDVSANVVGPCGAQISGGTINFLLDGNAIGSAEIMDNIAILNYAGFDEGKYNLSGYIDYQHESSIVNNATIDVELEGILDKITYYVSDNGSDENGNGSQDNPFKSISYAITQASKKSHDITINIGEGTYAGDLNTELTLSSINNITLVGAGIGKTIIDGENTNYFATIVTGENKVIVSNLTVQNMLPANVETFMSSNSLDALSTIIVDEGAALCLDNVNINNCHGGKAIILNKGSLLINNSIINNNGITTNIIDGNVIVDNTLFDENFYTKSLINGITSINNSQIKNAFVFSDSYNQNNYCLINGQKVTLENTKISNDGDNSSLKEIGYNEESDKFDPALSFYSRDVWANNISMICDYKSESIQDYWFEGSKYKLLTPFSNLVGERNVTVYNSTFRNFNCIWGTYLGSQIISFDGCIFDNMGFIAHIDLTEDSEYTVTNSIFINTDMVIDKYSAYYASEVSEFNCTFENNYWGSNDKPVVDFVRSNNGDPTYEPETWIVLVYEDGALVFKTTDGENETSYEGNLPAEIAYVADENGDVISVVNIDGTGYKVSVDENGSIVLNTAEPMKNIVPKFAVDETVFASDVAAVINDGSKFTANFTNKWGDPLKDTPVSFKVGENTINGTTDVNGTASFDIDFALGQYLVNVVNPVTGQSIVKTIIVTIDKTIAAGDVNATYNDNSIFSAVFTDEFGIPLANTKVAFTVGNDIINATTNVNGTASFTIDFNAGNYDVVVLNPVTGESVTKSIVVSPLATKLSASDLTMVYNTGKSLTVTLKDANGKALAKRDVVIVINGQTYKRVTDDNGQASLTITFAVKNAYAATITFNGDNNYLKSTASAKVVVTKATPKLTAKKATFKAKTKTKKYSVVLKDNKNMAMKKVKVTLKVKGKTYRATTNSKGKATFKITKLTKKGKHTATVKFAGNANFKAVSKKVKITVK